MHWFAAVILAPLLRLVDSFVGRVLLALGLGFATYTGLGTSLAWIGATIEGYMGGVPTVAKDLMGVLRMDQCVTVILSSIAVRHSLQGLKEGAKRLVNL